jgi:pyrroloquinoline quinone biosynthesis protein D
MSGDAREQRVPAFRRGIKFRFDTVRDAWVVLAPERLFVPDAQAVEILKLVDGVRTLGAITDDLCARFDAPRDLVIGDVAVMLDDLAEKGVMAW